MITAEQVLRVSETSEPLAIGGGVLTVEHLMRLPRDHWEGPFMRLTHVAALRIAAELRRDMEALARHAPEVLTGEIQRAVSAN
jgi:hypothetical protein